MEITFRFGSDRRKQKIIEELIKENKELKEQIREFTKEEGKHNGKIIRPKNEK